MIKLIASDLDGTLLKENGTISLETVEMIKSLDQKGIHFMAATGRSYESAKKALTRAGLNIPILCMNGANVYDVNGQLLFDTPIEKGHAKNIFKAINKETLYVEMYTNKGVFAPTRDQFDRIFKEHIKAQYQDYSHAQIDAHINQRFQEETFIFTSDFNLVLAEESVIPYKILAFSFVQEDLKQLKEKFIDKDGIYVTSSGADNLEFNQKEATKGNALHRYAKHLNIRSNEMMTIGDNENDLSMLTKTKYSVAMGNAKQIVKDTATYHTKTNNEEGVKEAILLALSINKTEKNK